MKFGRVMKRKREKASPPTSTSNFMGDVLPHGPLGPAIKLKLRTTLTSLQHLSATGTQTHGSASMDAGAVGRCTP